MAFICRFKCDVAIGGFQVLDSESSPTHTTIFICGGISGSRFKDKIIAVDDHQSIAGNILKNFLRLFAVIRKNANIRLQCPQ